MLHGWNKGWPCSHVTRPDNTFRQIIGIKIKKKVGERNSEREISKKFRHRVISCRVTCNEYSCSFSFLSTCFTMQCVTCSIHRFSYLFVQCFKDFILRILVSFKYIYIYEWFRAVIFMLLDGIYMGYFFEYKCINRNNNDYSTSLILYEVKEKCFSLIFFFFLNETNSFFKFKNSSDLLND